MSIIGSGNGLAPYRCQRIIWTNMAYFYPTQGNKFQWNLNRNSHIFINENAFESIICQIAVNLFPPQCNDDFKDISAKYQHQMHILCSFESKCRILQCEQWFHKGGTIVVTAISFYLCEGNPLQRTNDAELWWFHCCTPEQFVKQTLELPVMWGTITLMWSPCIFVS